MSEARLRALAPKQHHGSQLLFRVNVLPQPKASASATSSTTKLPPPRRQRFANGQLPTPPASPTRSSARQGASCLSQELIDNIVDHIATSDNFDPDFPNFSFHDLSACSLISRAWLHRSSHHLLGRLRFVPRTGMDASEEEGKRVDDRLKAFLKYTKAHSSRIRMHVTGIWIRWGAGMTKPLEYKLVRRIFDALPHLSLLRLYGMPQWPKPDKKMAEQEVQYEVDTLDIGNSWAAQSTQVWIFEQLRWFRRTRLLRLTSVGELNWETQTPVTKHLHVDELELEASSLTVFSPLSRMLTPGTVSMLKIYHVEQWGATAEAKYLDKFLKMHCQNLHRLSLHFKDSQAQTALQGNRSSLTSLASCTKLHSVEVKLDTNGWTGYELVRDIISHLPPGLPRIRISYWGFCSSYNADIADPVEWSTLAAGLARFSALRSVELHVQCDTLVSRAGPLGGLTPAQQQQQYLARVWTLVQENQWRMLKYLTPQLQAVTSLTLRFVMDREYHCESVAREVVYKVDCQSIQSVTDFAVAESNV